MHRFLSPLLCLPSFMLAALLPLACIGTATDDNTGRARNPTSEPSPTASDAGVGTSNPEPDPVDDSTRPADCPSDVAWVAELNGAVVFGDGSPVVGAKAQTCIRNNAGRLLCLSPSDTQSDGSFHVVIPSSARCMQRTTSRILLPLTDNGTLYCRIPLPLDSAVIDLDFNYTLFGTTPATTLPDRGDELTVRTVAFADGMEIDVVPDLMFGQDYAALAAAHVDPADVPSCVVQDAPSFDSVYWFSPEGDIRGRFPMRLPNTTGLAAGTVVDLYVQGGLNCSVDDVTLEEADWGEFGSATVDADGANITVDAQNGLPCFGTFGYLAQ